MKKLLFVYDSMMTGGTTTALLSLLHELNDSEYAVDLLLFEHSGDYLDQIPQQVRLLPEAKRPSKLHLSVSKRKILGTFLNGGFFKAAWAWYKYRNTPKGNLRNILMHYAVPAQVKICAAAEGKYDAAIGFMEGWSAHYVLSKKVCADKKIVWIHPDYQDSYLIPEVDRKALRKATAIVTVAEKCRKNMQSIFPEFRDQIVTIENIVSPELMQLRAKETDPQINGAQVDLCTVCRCDMSVKGLDRMLQAIAQLRDEQLFEDAKWHLIGDGKDMPKVRQLIEMYKLDRYVEAYGAKKNPLPYIKKMDLFVLPSRYEGKPVSVTEALCLGVPCLVTNYASAHEQIASGVNGLVVDNDDQALYEGLKKLLQDREYLKQLQTGVLTISYGNTEQIQKFYEIVR